MASVILEGLDEALMTAAREGARQALAEQSQVADVPSPWLDVSRTADYLSSTPAAIRALVKRQELPVHRTPNGRLLFDRSELDAWVRGGDAA
jgi:predicted ATPase